VASGFGLPAARLGAAGRKSKYRDAQWVVAAPHILA